MSLIFLFTDPDVGEARILLGRKNIGFGSGKVVGLGGHVDPGEDNVTAAVRELHEESALVIRPADCHRAGTVNFNFPGNPKWNMSVAIFVGHTWSGELAASPELDPEWFAIDDIPWLQMWDDSRVWLPHIVRGDRIEADFTYDESGTRVTESRLQVLGLG